MDDKKQLQDQELNDVIGGSMDKESTSTNRCPKCYSIYYLTQSYPDGFLVKEEKDGCSGTTYYFKCPSCGYEWTK